MTPRKRAEIFPKGSIGKTRWYWRVKGGNNRNTGSGGESFTGGWRGALRAFHTHERVIGGDGTLPIVLLYRDGKIASRLR